VVACPGLPAQQFLSGPEEIERELVRRGTLRLEPREEIEPREGVAFAGVVDQRAPLVQMPHDVHEPLFARAVPLNQPPDGEVDFLAPARFDQGVGGLLDPVVLEPVGGIE
jgi:hypothetical protein